MLRAEPGAEASAYSMMATSPSRVMRTCSGDATWGRFGSGMAREGTRVGGVHDSADRSYS